MERGNSWVRMKAAESLNPPQVETALIQLGRNWPQTAPPLPGVVEQFPLGEAALLHLLAVSSICATRLTRHPETLLWLCQPEVCLAPRGPAEMLAGLRTLAREPAANQNFAVLRFWKGREMTRVALRELAGVAPLEETTGELSYIAEICIRRVFEHWNRELRQRYGSPKAEFAILGLGKLGGGELNHSSDVDLLFVYSEEGQLTPHISYHEFFNRLGNKILETFSTPDPTGSLFRVDLRLRPEGSAGPLARSLESMENYYAGFGETWERIALIKACRIAGSLELAYRLPEATSAVHLSKKRNARSAGGNCEYQASHRTRRSRNGKNGARCKTWARRHSRDRIHRANPAAYPWRASSVSAGSEHAQGTLRLATTGFTPAR